MKTFEQHSEKWKVTIKAKSGIVNGTTDLSQLDGIDCQDRFSDYVSTFSGAVSGGYMRFEYEDGGLWTITEYKSNRKLTDDELNKLGEDTQGQWSDGIGEGFEQQPCTEIDDEEVYICPWYSGQKLIITQEQL